MNFGTFIFACVALFVCFISLSFQAPVAQQKLDPSPLLSNRDSFTKMEPQQLARYVRNVVDQLNLMDPASLKGLLSAQTGFNSRQMDAIIEELEKDL